jgi:hypothetical protein
MSNKEEHQYFDDDYTDDTWSLILSNKFLNDNLLKVAPRTIKGFNFGLMVPLVCVIKY